MGVDDDRDRVGAPTLEAGAKVGAADVRLGFSVMIFCVIAALIVTLLS